MRKLELDRLLEKTVADALGVRLPHRRNDVADTRHNAKSATRRHRHTGRELHPA